MPRGARTRALLAAERLAWVHPSMTDLEFANPFQLLVITILSAQSTDRRANQLGAGLLGRYPDAASLADASLDDVEDIIRLIGFFRTKERTLLAAARVVAERYDGAVPTTMPDLLAVPGIGRKSANLMLGLAVGMPGIVTDRHLVRVAHRLRLVSESGPDRVEQQLVRLLPRRDWTDFSLRMTLHGRYVCVARRPLREGCVLNDFCPTPRPEAGRPRAGSPFPLAGRGSNRRLRPTIATGQSGMRDMGDDPTTNGTPAGESQWAFRSVWFWIIAAVTVGVYAFLVGTMGGQRHPTFIQLSYTAFAQQVVSGNVSSVTVKGAEIDGHLRKSEVDSFDDSKTSDQFSSRSCPSSPAVIWSPCRMPITSA